MEARKHINTGSYRVRVLLQESEHGKLLQYSYMDARIFSYCYEAWDLPSHFIHGTVKLFDLRDVTTPFIFVSL